MKSKSIIRQLTEAPIHAGDAESDVYIATITLTRGKIIVQDLELGQRVELSDPAGVRAAWGAYTQSVVANFGAEPDEVAARRKVEIMVPYSVARRVVVLGQALEPGDEDDSAGAVLGTPAVARVFSERILKDRVSASTPGEATMVTRTMLARLARDYHLVRCYDDGGSDSTLSAAKAFGVDAIKIKVKHRSQDGYDDESYCVFARSGPEFDKLARMVSRDTTNSQ